MTETELQSMSNILEARHLYQAKEGCQSPPPKGLRLVDHKTWFQMRKLQIQGLYQVVGKKTYLPWGECEVLLRCAFPAFSFETEVVNNGPSWVETKLSTEPSETEKEYYSARGVHVFVRKGKYGENWFKAEQGDTYTVKARLYDAQHLIFGQWYSLAVTDNTHKTIANPTCDELENAIQRAIVKVVARETGIGHDLYEHMTHQNDSENRNEWMRSALTQIHQFNQANKQGSSQIKSSEQNEA